MTASPTPHPPVVLAGSTRTGRPVRWLVLLALILAGTLTFGYAGISLYLATQLVYVPQLKLTASPADLGLQYQNVTFPSRGDQVKLRGWFIPGVLPDGSLTSQRAIIVLHGSRSNRTDPGFGLLKLSGALAQHGFAVLAFDMRGMGESPPAPFGLGYLEQRDALGAVDFLRSGSLPYPALGHPRAIGGFGVSLGGATMVLAAAQEPHLQAIVSDSAYADIIPILEREIPKAGHLPAAFTPGGLLAARALYGIDYYAVRPVDVIAGIAPRPLLLIHGANDHYIPPVNLDELATAARANPHAQVQTWLVPGADHAQAYKVSGDAYVARLIAFYTTALGA